MLCQAGNRVTNVFSYQSRGNGNRHGQVSKARAQPPTFQLMPGDFFSANLRPKEFETLLVCEERERERLMKTKNCRLDTRVVTRTDATPPGISLPDVSF